MVRYKPFFDKTELVFGTLYVTNFKICFIETDEHKSPVRVATRLRHSCIVRKHCNKLPAVSIYTEYCILACCLIVQPGTVFNNSVD